MVHPVFLSLGPLELRWYGLCVAAGMVAAYVLQLKRAHKFGFKPDDVSDITFTGVCAGLVGARLLYVIRFYDEFRGAPLDTLKIYKGGLVFYGGFLLAIVALLLLSWKRHWDLGKLADLLAPALPLGHAFGRIGCLLNGCCFGFPYEGPLAIRYPAFVGENAMNPVLDTQLRQGLLPFSPDLTLCHPTFPIEGVAALANLCLCGVILWLEHKKHFEGRRFLIYLILYAAGRFLLEFGRGDYLSKTWGLSPSQLHCLWLLPLAVVLFVWTGRRKASKTP
jgi:phosphatidylglycerol:prolipoprotein diacylglycerol transferase